MIAAIILAGGESRRMGTAKAHLAYPEADGSESTFLSHLIRVFGESRAEPVVVVVGHDAATIAASVPQGQARVVVNDDYRSGMLSSIQSGIAALAPEPVDGALICPVDHPDIEPSVVDALIESFEAKPCAIVLPVFGELRGHPVLFARSVFEDIANAPASVGARQVVWDHADDLRELPVTAKGVTTDVDTPSDYRAFRGQEVP